MNNRGMPQALTAAASRIVVALALLAAPAAAAGDMAGSEGEVAAARASGDSPRLFRALESLLIRHPAHPVTALYYRAFFDMADSFGNAAVEKTARLIGERLEAGNDEAARRGLLAFTLEFERFMYRYDAAGAKRLTDLLHPVRHWTLCGPYRRFGRGDLFHHFPPELVADPAAIHERKTVRVTEADGWLDPGRYLYPARGIAYGRFSFRTSATVRVRVFSCAPYLVFINGREAARNLPERRRLQRVIEIRNARGLTVMLKMSGGPFDKMRVLLTDADDRPISPDFIPDETFTDECETVEIPPYPHGPLAEEAAGESLGGYRHMGCYFDLLEDDEAISWHRRSITEGGDRMDEFRLSSALMRSGGRDRSSPEFARGVGILRDVRTRDRNFIPAAVKDLELMTETRNYLAACREGGRLAMAAPRSHDAGLAHIRILRRLGYERELEGAFARMDRAFPESSAIIEEKALWHFGRDQGKALAHYLDLLARKNTTGTLRAAAALLADRNDMAGALDLIAKYDYRTECTDERIRLMMRMGDYGGARKLIFKSLVIGDRPSLYHALGAIDLLQGDDPSMYFQKLLNIAPSLFDVADRAGHSDGGASHPFECYRDAIGTVDASWSARGEKRFPAEVLYRARIHLLLADGGSRIYCEDVVLVNTEEGANAWREVRIPLGGSFRPLHLIAFGGRGGRTDPSSVRTLGGEHRVSFDVLGPGSVIHLAYLVDNPADDRRAGRWVSPPVQFLQGYDEPVHRALVKVVAPAGRALGFHLKPGAAVTESLIDEMKMHAVEYKRLPAVPKERHSGGRINCLAHYTFTVMNGYDDVAAWYHGLLAGREEIPAESVDARLSGGSVEETVRNVYNLISDAIEPQSGAQYHPVRPADTMFRGRGTAENRVLLARAVLKQLGIQSYIALARGRFLTADNRPVSPLHFNGILLCVPLRINEALWLDFSRGRRGCGTVSPEFEGTEAMVLVNDTYRLRKISGRDVPPRERRYDIAIDDQGGAAVDVRVAVADPRGWMRPCFGGSPGVEEHVAGYFAGVIPAFSIDSFKAETPNGRDTLFVLSVKGRAAGLAAVGSRSVSVPPLLGRSEIHQYARERRRTHPLVIRNAINEREFYRYTLPSRFSDLEVNKSRGIVRRFGKGELRVMKKRGSLVMEVRKSVTVPAAVIPPAEYGDFLEFCLEMGRIEGDRMTLGQ